VKVFFRLAGFAFGFALLLCSASVSAQTPTKRIEATVMFDEYGTIGGCDHSARLDNLAIAVQHDPNLESYVVYYGPESASELTLGIISDYLVNSRGIAEDRFKTVYAGPNSDPREPRIQLWLAPQGAPAPELVRYENKAETFNGMFEEHQGWDEIYLEGGEGGTGPPVPGVSLATFVDMLKNRKDTLAYIVAFSGTEAAPGAWRRVAQEESEHIQSKGVAADRLRTIYGGSDKKSKETKIQLWILPENAPSPVADAGPEPPPNKTILIGSKGDYELGNERIERWAFEVLLGAFRASKELRVCIIVRQQQAEEAEQPEEANEATPPVADLTTAPDEVPEPQPADLLKLIDNWKTELAVKYKISEDRLVVLFAPAREFEGNVIETWIVPPGGLLPDPGAEPAEETSDEAKPVAVESKLPGLH
jgi:hypothetical protein